MNTVTVQVSVDKAGAELLRRLAATLEGTPPQKATSTVAAATLTTSEPKKRGPGRPPKAKAAEPEPEEETKELDEELDDTDLDDEPEDDTDLDDGGDEEPEEEDEAEEPAKPVKKAKGPTLEGDIIPGFQAYAKSHGRDKAAALLKKLKAKSVRDLPVDRYAEVLKLLKK